ncbi:Uncharacterised protein [Cytobacillus firmus]|nr:hypothetical protein [Cytobacillus firmus]SUV00805.1 Uncharacterised protein [Cytobacillus firmus]
MGERRTFIATPYSFRIELQTNKEIADSVTDNIRIEELRLETKKKGLEDDLSILFGKPVSSIKSVFGETVTINEAVIKGLSSKILVDPNGVRIMN